MSDVSRPYGPKDNGKRSHCGSGLSTGDWVGETAAAAAVGRIAGSATLYTRAGLDSLPLRSAWAGAASALRNRGVAPVTVATGEGIHIGRAPADRSRRQQQKCAQKRPRPKTPGHPSMSKSPHLSPVYTTLNQP